MADENDIGMDADNSDDHKRGRGRPPKYKPEFSVQAEKLCKLGATDADLADFFDVAVRTIERWKTEHEDFCRALKDAKEVADQRVERSLYQRAVGYQADAVKIFMPANADEPVYAEYRENVQPDVTAAIFWLKNRKPDAWKDRKDVTSDNRHHHSAEPVRPFAEFLEQAIGLRPKDPSEEPVS